MAVPKRRKSKARTSQHRAQYRSKHTAPHTVACPRCEEPKLPHRVCANCGYYGDRQVLEVEEEST